jgi:hypothetical protein
MKGLVAASTFVCCSLLAGSAMPEYQGPDYVKLKALLPPGPDAALCFARTYDAEHLKQHAQQNVTEMLLLVRYVALAEDEATLIPAEGGGTAKQYFSSTLPWRQRSGTAARPSIRAATAPLPKASVVGSIAMEAASSSNPSRGSPASFWFVLSASA